MPLKPKLDWDTVKDFSQAIVQHLARTIPQRFVAKSGARNRIGRIFVDYLRNGFGATTAAAWSARARPGLGISVPVGWDELAGLKGGDQWTIATAREHISFQKRRPVGRLPESASNADEGPQVTGARRGKAARPPPLKEPCSPSPIQAQGEDRRGRGKESAERRMWQHRNRSDSRRANGPGASGRER